MEAAKEKLVTENMRLAGYMVKRYSNTGIEWEELQAICYLGLVEAAARFEESRGISFSTLACTCIKNAVLKTIRDRKALKRDFVTVSLDTPISREDGKTFTLEDILPVEEPAFGEFEEEDLLHGIRTSDRLRGVEREALLLWLAGERQDVIGKKIGHSQPYVSRIIKKGAEKLYACNYL